VISPAALYKSSVPPTPPALYEPSPPQSLLLIHRSSQIPNFPETGRQRRPVVPHRGQASTGEITSLWSLFQYPSDLCLLIGLPIRTLPSRIIRSESCLAAVERRREPPQRRPTTPFVHLSPRSSFSLPGESLKLTPSSY
jgi:hypothetical protein